MANSQAEIMLSILAKDNASATMKSIDANAQSMASNISNAMSSINSGFMNLGQVTDNIMGSLTGKSALDNILGTASKAETNNVLLSMMTDTEDGAESLYKTVDEVTDSSLTSMQELIPALKTLKAATGATDKEIEDATDTVANFGAMVLAQTGSTELAQTAMMDLSKGIKGNYAALDQYGITEDALMRTGLWTGREDDVDGYMAAIDEVIGSTEALMDTNQGLDALIAKAFSRAGKKIGNEFLPMIKDIKRGFIDLDNLLGGNLSASILAVSGGVEVMNNALWNVSTTVQGFKDLSEGASFLIKQIRGVEEAAEMATGALQTMGNASEVMNGAGAAGAAGGAIGAGADVAKSANKGEKVVGGGIDALALADLLKDSTSNNKTVEEVLSELKTSDKYFNRLQDELDTAMEAEGKIFDIVDKRDSAKDNITSGVFSKGMRKQLEKEVQAAEDAIDDIVGTDLWNGVKSKFDKNNPIKKMDFVGELEKSCRGETGSHSQGFLLDRIFNKKENPLLNGDLNKEAKTEASEILAELKGVSKDFMFDDDVLEEWEKSEWGLTDAIKNKVGNFKSKITGAFSSIKNFDLIGAIKSPFKKLTNFDFGGKLQSILEKGFGGLGNIASKIKGKFTSFGKSLLSIKDIDVAGKIKNAFGSFDKKIYQSIKGFSFKDTFGGLKDSIKGLRGTAEVLEEADDIGDSIKGAKGIVNGVDEVADAGQAISAAGPALEAGAAGGEAAAAGATGLAATFTSMIVPLLAISAVIIIMIPIVAVIAAEAMIFIKLLAQFMEALNFDNINLDGAIKGISQVATALAWVGVAMAAMSFASIMTGLAVITGGFAGILGPLDVAVDAIKDAAKKLAAFNSVQIDESVAKNIKMVSDSLMSVSEAMMALTWNNIVTGFSEWIAGALDFGSVTDALEQSKNDIIEASTKLNEFAGLTPIDEAVANNIQNVCDSLASVGNAMSALRDIRDSENWDAIIGDLIGGIFGEGVDIQQALTDVKEDVYKAAESLQNWELPTLADTGIGEKIKSVSDALSSVAEAFKVLRGFRDDNIWDDMLEGIFGSTDIKTALKQVMDDINAAADALKNVQIDDTINEDFIAKIKNVVSALGEVTNVVNGLTALPPMKNFDTSTITTAVNNVQSAADALGKLVIGEVNEEVITTIKNVAGAITEVSGVMTSLTSLPPMEGYDPTQISTAVSTVQTIANELSKLTETTFNSEATNGLLTSIQTALTNLKATLSGASGFSEASMSIGTQIVSGVQTGMNTLGTTVQTSVSSAINSAKPTANTYGKGLGSNATEGFKSTLKLADVMTAEMGYVKTAVDNGIEAAKTAARNGAEEVVQAFKEGVNVGSPGDIARTMSGEMAYTLQAIKDSYYSLRNAAYIASRTIVEAFGNPTLGYETFLDANLKASDIGALETTLSPAPTPIDNRPVIINIGEGAVNVDARNKTTQEARQIMITALESLDNVKDVVV